jgi:hypothetical protein
MSSDVGSRTPPDLVPRVPYSWRDAERRIQAVAVGRHHHHTEAVHMSPVHDRRIALCARVFSSQV